MWSWSWQQRGVDGVVLVETPAWFRPKKSQCFSSNPNSSSQAGGIPSYKRVSLFILFRTSTEEGTLLYSVYWFKCQPHPKTPPYKHNQNNAWPNIRDLTTQSNWYTKLTITVSLIRPFIICPKLNALMQNQLHSSWDLVKMQNLLFKNYEKYQHDESRALNQVQVPSEHGALVFRPESARLP